MYKLIMAVAIVFVVTGCSSMSLKEQSPEPSYAVSESILVSVIDDRNNGKQKNYIGVFHGPIFNNEFYIEDIANQPGDEARDLAEYLSLRLTEGMSKGGWNSAMLAQTSVPSVDMANLMMKENNAKYLFIIDIRDWDIAGKDGYVLTTDVDLLLFKSGQGRVLDTNVRRSKEMAIEGLATVPQLFQKGYRIRLTELLNDRKLREALAQ